MVTEAFDTVYRRGVIVKVIVLPSFNLEYAVAVQAEGDQYSIITQRVESRIWSTLAENDLQLDDLPPFPTQICTKPIDENLALRIEESWTQVLLETRYEVEHMPNNDGITYHFSTASPFGMAGRTNSPDEDSKPGLLVSIANSLFEICASNDPQNIKTLERTLDQLETAFGTSK